MAAEATTTATGTELAASPSDFLTCLIPDHYFSRMISCLLARFSVHAFAFPCMHLHQDTLAKTKAAPMAKNCQMPNAKSCQPL